MAVYDRLSTGERRAAVAMAALLGFMSPFTSTSVIPLAQPMALSLHANEQDIRTFAVALFVAVMGIAPLLLAFASMAMPSALLVFPVMNREKSHRNSKRQLIGSATVLFLPLLYMLASILLASKTTTTTIGSLAALRCIQSLAISPFPSVGAATVRQLYCVRTEFRGAALGCFYAGAVAGPTMGPFVAGCIGLGGGEAWRGLFWLQAGVGLFASLMQVYLTIRCQRAEDSKEVVVTIEEDQRARDTEKGEPKEKRTTSVARHIRHAFGWPFWLVTLSSCASMFGLFLGFNTLTKTLQTRFSIHNSAAVGALYLPGGVTSVVTSVLSGAWSDRLLRPKPEVDKDHVLDSGEADRNSRPRRSISKLVSLCSPAVSTYERRLIVAITGAGILQPAGLLLYGWSSYKSANAGLLVLFEIGFCLLCGGVSLTLTAGNAYLVDIAGNAATAQRSIAFNNLFRYALAVAASAETANMLQNLGLGLSATVAAACSLVSLAALVVVASQKQHAIGRL